MPETRLIVRARKIKAPGTPVSAIVYARFVLEACRRIAWVKLVYRDPRSPEGVTLTPRFLRER